MSNVLNEQTKQQVIALGRLGWPLRRIQQRLDLADVLDVRADGRPSAVLAESWARCLGRFASAVAAPSFAM